MSCSSQSKLGGLALSLLLLSGCGAKADPRPGEAPLLVEVAQVSQGTGGATSDATGSSYAAVIAFDREAVLSPRVGGTIELLPATIGATLRRGSLIAALNDTPYRAAFTRASADADRLARAQARNQTLLGAGAVAQADVQDTQSGLAAAQAARSAAAYDLASTRLRMPFDGVVLSKAVERGAVVGAGQPVVTVADTRSSRIARVQVPSADVAALHRGMAADVVVNGMAAPLTGHILRTGALSDARTGTVEVDVALPPTTLASGTVASVRFPGSLAARTRGNDTATDIPAEALVDSHNGQGHVFIVDPQRHVARLVPITVAGFDDEQLRVAGLPAHAQVITTGAGYVADGQPVTVLAR